MVLNFRKIASILASAVMVGSTVAVAAAADMYPAPFIKGGNADVAVVIGSKAQLTDMVAVSDISVNLQKALAGQTATTTGGSSTGASASGGDSIFLSSSARKLYFGDAINADKNSLSDSHLPTLLKGGKVVDLRGTEYSYQQTIAVGGRSIDYSRSGSNFDDPVLQVALSTSATTAPLYNYTFTLNKNLNITDATNVQGQKIVILGVEYIIGTDSTSSAATPILALNGAGQTLSLAGGDSANFTIGGVSHTVELKTTTSATGARIVVDGVSRDVTESSTYAFAGGLNIFVKDVTHPSFAGDLRTVDLIVGANTITLTNGQSVTYGSDATTIQGTRATVTTTGGLLSGFSVSIAAPDSANDAITTGGAFTDPVFGGMKVQFGGATPSLNDSSRGTVVVDTDNNRFATVKFTPTRGGTEETVKYAYDNTSSETTIQPLLAYSDIDANDYIIHVLEGEDAKVNDYIVVNKGDQVGQGGSILKVSTIQVTDDSSASNDYVTFQDVFTGDETKISLTNSTAGYTASTQTLGGVSGYTVSSSAVAGGALENLRVNVTWNSGTRAIFPRIRLKDGGWLAFLTATTVSNATSLLFPDGATTLATSGDTGRQNSSNGEMVNGINWTYTARTGSTTVIDGINNPGCNFNATFGPAILLIEDKKWNDATYGNFVCIPLTSEGTSTLKMAISTPAFNGSNSGFVTHRSVDNTASAVDKFGTLVTYDTNDNNRATINMPGAQMFADVLFTSDQAVVTPGIASSSSGGTVKDLGTPTVADTQAASLTTKNLIVVGGSCVNSVAATLLGSSTPLCGADFTTKTGVEANQYIIKTYTWGTGKVATLVAGFNAEDTSNAATYLRTKDVEIAVGKGVKGTTSTTATPLTESTTTTA